MLDILQQIKDLLAAYDIYVFPPPDWKKVHEVLEAEGLSLDSVSAACMRHALQRVIKFIEQPEKGENENIE